MAGNELIMTYEEYIASPLWAKLRKAKIKKDNRCQGCGKSSQLEVHHIKYPSRWNYAGILVADWSKDKLENLTTLCRECHEAITSVLRSRKYAGDKIRLLGCSGDPKRSFYESEENAIRVERCLQIDDAQRQTRQSIGSDSEADQENLRKAVENGGGFRANVPPRVSGRFVSE